MIRSLWIARTGLDAQQTQLDVIANNLANVSTKRLQAGPGGIRRSALPDPPPAGRPVVPANPDPHGPPVGDRCQAGRSRPHLHPGQCPEDRQFPSISQSRATGSFRFCFDGTTAYTRDGSFQKDNQGQIVTSDGFPSPAITIPANALSLSVGQDGTVTVTQAGSTATTQIGSIQLATFINPGGLQSLGQNLFRKPPRRDPHAQHPGNQRSGNRQPGLSKLRMSTGGRGIGDDDPDPAGLRTQFQGGLDVRPDVGPPDPALRFRDEAPHSPRSSW